jgi:hypothetical protein
LTEPFFNTSVYYYPFFQTHRRVSSDKQLLGNIYCFTRLVLTSSMCIKCLKEGFLQTDFNSSHTKENDTSSARYSNSPNIRPKWSPIENSVWWNEHVTIDSFQRDGSLLRYCYAVPTHYLFHLIITPEWGLTFLQYSHLLEYCFQHSIAVWIFDQRSQGISILFIHHSSL